MLQFDSLDYNNMYSIMIHLLFSEKQVLIFVIWLEQVLSYYVSL